MALKKRREVTEKDAQKLADEIADKPYGGQKESGKTDKRPKSKKKSNKKMKPRTLLWDDDHFEMLNEISRVTMIPKQRILRNILNPGIEKMYKKEMENE